MSKGRGTEEYTYTVRRMTKDGHYEVSKWGSGDAPEEQYDVQIPYVNSTNGLWCNCPGFRRQRYPKEQHKHIRLVRMFIKQNEPTGRVYGLPDPQGEPIVVKESMFNADPEREGP